MKSTYLAIFALFVIAAVVFETEATSSTKTSICTPEAFEWLIENCPTESPSRRAVRRLERGNYEGAIKDVGMRRILRAIGDCCGSPGCTKEELLLYC